MGMLEEADAISNTREAAIKKQALDDASGDALVSTVINRKVREFTDAARRRLPTVSTGFLQRGWFVDIKVEPEASESYLWISLVVEVSGRWRWMNPLSRVGSWDKFPPELIEAGIHKGFVALLTRG